MMISKYIKLSIIVITKNRIDWLKISVDHLLSELSVIDIDYELIAVCGESSDGTVDYLKSLGKFTEIIENSDNGVARSFLDGCNVANGEYILGIHDHMLIFMNPIIKACSEMGSNSKISCVFINQYMAGEVSPLKYNYVDFSSLLITDAFLFKADVIKYIDKNYKHYWWSTDLVFQMLLQGKAIASTKEVSAIEFRMPYDKSNRNKYLDKKNKDSTEYFMNKFKVMLRILDNYPPLYKRLSTKLYGILLKFFVRIIYSRIFRKIVNLRYDSFRKSPIPPLCPSLNSNRLPPEYVKFIKESKRLDELDQRYPYLYIQSILEFLLEKKSGYPMVSKKSNSSLFLVQQLPQSLLDKIKDSV